MDANAWHPLGRHILKVTWIRLQ